MSDNERRDLILNVENFGPIASAKDVAIKPMTVFVGPSNTGKSYLAILLHAMLQAKSNHQLGIDYIPRIQRTRNAELSDIAIDTVLSEIGIQVDQLPPNYRDMKSPIPWDALPDTAKDFVRRYSAHQAKELSEYAKETIREFFELDELMDISTGAQSLKSPLSIRLRDSSGYWELNPSSDSSRFDTDNLEIRISDIRRLIYPDNEQRIIGDEEYRRFLLSQCFDLSLSTRIHSMVDSVYFPAARTGIITGWQTLTSNVIRNASRFAIDREHIVPYNKISTDFLDLLIRAPVYRRRYSRPQGINGGSLAQIADMLEKSLLDGSVEMSDSDIGPPEIIYSHRGLKVPMFRASSMVTELAPIVLFLRSHMKIGDLLIIEEPESHLHPAAQQKIAAALAFMVRSGLRVLITTHSHYMVEQISTLVNASYAGPEERAQKLRLLGPEIDADLHLDEDEVAVYGFALEDSEKGGTVVQEVLFDPDEWDYTPQDHSWAISDQFNRNSRMLSARFKK